MNKNRCCICNYPFDKELRDKIKPNFIDENFTFGRKSAEVIFSDGREDLVCQLCVKDLSQSYENIL
jgi:hypothetical protein